MTLSIYPELLSFLRLNKNLFCSNQRQKVAYFSLFFFCNMSFLKDSSNGIPTPFFWISLLFRYDIDLILIQSLLLHFVSLSSKYLEKNNCSTLYLMIVRDY